MEKLLKNRYLLKELLGNGASGQVYKVWDIVLEKYWALKVFHGINGFKEKEQWEEINALKSLNHPGFPGITDAFMEDNNTYLIMDYVEGITLEEYYEKCFLVESTILEIGIQLANALLYMHERDKPLLYLDLKPSNILINENKKVKIVDLGSVKVKGDISRVSGTPGFASPEQRILTKEGRGLNEQSDIYSLGMVLFSMVQRSSSHLPIVEKEKKRGILVRKYNAAISRPTENVIEKATRGSMAGRYNSIREMKSDMEASLKKLTKNKITMVAEYVGKNNKPEFWQQERNVMCCAGKKNLYFPANLFIVLFLLLLISWSEIQPFFLESHAKMEIQRTGSIREDKINKVYAQEEDEIISSSNEKLKVNIRDKKLRKVLIKSGSNYRVDGSLILEIPLEDFKDGEYEMKLLCFEGDRCKGEFYLVCDVTSNNRNRNP